MVFGAMAAAIGFDRGLGADIGRGGVTAPRQCQDRRLRLHRDKVRWAEGWNRSGCQPDWDRAPAPNDAAKRKPVDGGANGARFPYVSFAPAGAKFTLCTGRGPRGSPRNPGLWHTVQRFCKSLLTVRRERTYIQPSTAGLLRAAAAGRLSELLRPLATRSTDRGSQFDRQRV